MDLHAISTGSMRPEQLAVVISELNESFDAVHLREPQWTVEQSNAFFQWYLEQTFTIKLIVNKKTPGWEAWSGTVHSPSGSVSETGGGKSIHSVNELLQAETEKAAFVISGPVLPPLSAPKQVMPLHEQREVLRCASVPVIGIGGAEKSTLNLFYERGYSGAGFLSAVMEAEEPGKVGEQLRKERDRLCTI
ncbi:thiamine phosphate synthase [Alkalicoccus luteus]|uniref:Thiamine phosphate synthase/TenI domain-containing protein n=1 Tax=Alkalicoccus luteus TaxID=1237094 RepID=A0A969TV61_9BACI|nr:thiamine phosphate synthase [Alkalicoccus luteus]NJP38080.1 hypothetical protein [Alkalicoccus luteus]